MKIAGSTQVDDMLYSYYANTNKLQAVTEQGTGTTDHKLGDFTDKNTTATDYGYDVNGNMVTDLNKKLNGTAAQTVTSGGAIVYNYLNLPQTINAKKDDNTTKGTITYTYDAAGNKLKKVTVDNTVTPAKTTTTDYINGFIYENDKLQFTSQEEGRIRAVYDAAGTMVTGFVFDYFIKDHLGNVRMVLTEEQKQDAYPAASMEDVADKTNLNDPKNYIPYYSSTDYTTNSSLRYPISSVSGYPTDDFTTPNNYVTKLRGDGQKIGPGIVLKVMAGDKFNIRVSSWYKTNGASPYQPQSPLTDLVALLNNSIGGITSTHGGVSITELQNSGVLSPGATSFLSTQTPLADRPKAYLNWVLFDEQFKFVQASSNAEQVPAESAFGTAPNQLVYPHIKSNLPVDKNGYLYVYVSNETPNIDVFFDNLQVTHIRGPLLEETHYYPFGLTMSGISSRALTFGGTPNRKKFNGIEHTTEFDLNTYDAFFRNADPQIGRWWQIDPKPNLAESPYSMMSNNPVFNIDPLGDTIINGQKVEPQTPGAATYLENVTVTGKRIKAGLVNNPCTSCHIPYANVRDAQNQMFYEAMQNLDKAYGQVLPPRSPAIDLFFGHREIEAPDWWDDDVVDNLINNGGILEVGADGYIIGPKPRVITGMPPAVGLRGMPQIPSLTQRAANLSKQIGKNSITIRTVNGHIRYDLVGKAHGHVLTPHSLRYTRNISPSGMINFSKPKFPTPITQQDLRIIRNYLKSLQ